MKITNRSIPLVYPRLMKRREVLQVGALAPVAIGLMGNAPPPSPGLVQGHHIVLGDHMLNIVAFTKNGTTLLHSEVSVSGGPALSKFAERSVSFEHNFPGEPFCWDRKGYLIQPVGWGVELSFFNLPGDDSNLFAPRKSPPENTPSDTWEEYLSYLALGWGARTPREYVIQEAISTLAEHHGVHPPPRRMTPLDRNDPSAMGPDNFKAIDWVLGASPDPDALLLT